MKALNAKTEKEKMLACEMYDAYDIELRHLRELCRKKNRRI